MSTPRVDPELVRQAQSGDRHALDVVVGSTYAGVFRLALTLTASRADAEDLTQETFVRAVRALPGFRGESSVETWLWSIALNVARSRWRSPAPVPAELPERPEDGSDPAEVFETTELRHRLAGALLALPEASREILVLRDVLGLSNTEAAAAAGISPTAAKVRLFRAREALARQLDPDAEPSRRRR